MKKLPIILCAVLSAMTLVACDKFVPVEEHGVLQQENSSLSERNTELRGEIRDLKQQLEDSLETERTAVADIDPYDAAILESLFQRKDLIPVGSDEISFYPELCYVLGENYVYAYAEDGRASADMIFSYKKESDGTMKWVLELYNIGSNWLIMDQETGQPKIQEPRDAPGASSNADATIPVSSGSIVPSDVTPPPSLPVPVPTEAQQAKFREIAELVQG